MVANDTDDERFDRLPGRVTGSPHAPAKKPLPMALSQSGPSGYTVEGEIAMFGQLASGATEVRGVRGLVVRGLVLLFLVLLVVGTVAVLVSR